MSSTIRSAIDAAGRIVIPKAIRDELGLTGDVPVDVRGDGGRIVIEPVPAALRLVKRGRGLVAEPETALPSLTAEQVREALECGRR